MWPLRDFGQMMDLSFLISKLGEGARLRELIHYRYIELRMEHSQGYVSVNYLVINYPIVDMKELGSPWMAVKYPKEYVHSLIH